MATRGTTNQPTETIFGDHYDQHTSQASQSHDRNGGRRKFVPPVVGSHKLAHARLAPVGASHDRRGSHLAAQSEAAWDDEYDVRQFARHSSGSHTAGIVRQPAGSSHGSGR